MEPSGVVSKGGVRDSLIVCQNSQGLEIRATPVRITRYLVVFEVYNPYSILQLSEVLSDFRIFMNDSLVYSGRAVVSNMLNTGIMLVCEASLDEAWLDVDIFSPINQRDRLQSEFREFLQEWQKIYQVMPAFKVVVADIQTFLVDLRRWMEQVELGVRSQPVGNRVEMERDIIHDLEQPIFPELAPLLERFEHTSSLITDDLRPNHCNYAKRQLHPIVSCAPFFYRCWQKPLGYAGDYEMVNMMIRDPYEGSTMFAKMLNGFFLNTPPVTAHRNRIDYMTHRLSEETRKWVRQGTRMKVFNLGCGPAQEIQKFMKEDEICDRVDFSLLDFNEQTLEYTSNILKDIKMRQHRTTGLKTILKSVHQILKEAARPGPDLQREGFQFVYCAGLFDYLSDRICKRLMDVFYELVAPGGLLLATNVEAANPSRNWMEYVVEWHLVYRDKEMFKKLKPDKASDDSFTVTADSTGVNIFLEVRKPAHG